MIYYDLTLLFDGESSSYAAHFWLVLDNENVEKIPIIQLHISIMIKAAISKSFFIKGFH